MFVIHSRKITLLKGPTEQKKNNNPNLTYIFEWISGTHMYIYRITLDVQIMGVHCIGMYDKNVSSMSLHELFYIQLRKKTFFPWCVAESFDA
jgi:hypothetical protein